MSALADPTAAVNNASTPITHPEQARTTGTGVHPQSGVTGESIDHPAHSHTDASRGAAGSNTTTGSSHTTDHSRFNGSTNSNTSTNIHGNASAGNVGGFDSHNAGSHTGSATGTSTTGTGTHDDVHGGEPDTAPEGGYPEQKHAGKVGYGPNYGKSAGLGEKMTGVKEELKGKMTHNPELVQHGHDRKTGELKRRELQGDDVTSPANATQTAEGRTNTTHTGDPTDTAGDKFAKESTGAATVAERQRVI